MYRDDNQKHPGPREVAAWVFEIDDETVFRAGKNGAACLTADGHSP